MTAMDPITLKRFHVVEWSIIVLVASLSVSAVVLVSLGLAADLGENGNRATDVKVLNNEPHTQPTFTFCAEGATGGVVCVACLIFNRNILEGTLPPVGYCSWSNVLDFRVRSFAAVVFLLLTCPAHIVHP
jgi:hypothetical protein